MNSLAGAALENKSACSGGKHRLFLHIWVANRVYHPGIRAAFPLSPNGPWLQ
jgi:hypothetical protein